MIPLGRQLCYYTGDINDADAQHDPGVSHSRDGPDGGYAGNTPIRVLFELMPQEYPETSRWAAGCTWETTSETRNRFRIAR